MLVYTIYKTFKFDKFWLTLVIFMIYSFLVFYVLVLLLAKSKSKIYFFNKIY